jgi:unsaturated rhamnogalacturonyl hydrolase
MSQVKARLPKPYLYPPFMDVDCSLRDQLAGLKALQTENGLWRTVLDDSESYEELSASCGIAAAMIVNNNPLHTKHVSKALGGILDNITPDGRLLHVSGGTAVMNDLNGYRTISRDWTQGWGQGLALAFLTAALYTDRG